MFWPSASGVVSQRESVALRSAGTRQRLVCETAPVHNERAQLSSATTSLEELLDRVSSTAEAVLAAGDESLASDLFEVERSLRTAHRRLVSATRRAG
jgi:phage shock protein A